MGQIKRYVDPGDSLRVVYLEQQVSDSLRDPVSKVNVESNRRRPMTSGLHICTHK